MRKTLGLVCLVIALLAGYACSQDSATSTPTAPEVAATSTSGLQNTFAASASKVYICHGNKSEPYGVVVEVSDEYFKRHLKHINNNLDCICPNTAVAGEPCDTYSPGSNACYYSCPD